MGRPPAAGSATQNNMMGRVSKNPYSRNTMVDQTAPKTSSGSGGNMPMYAALVVAGVGLIMLMRSRTVQTGPLVTLQQPAPVDQSTIDNLTNSILAIAGQVHQPSPNPGGGATSPIVVSPHVIGSSTGQTVGPIGTLPTGRTSPGPINLTPAQLAMGIR